MGRGFLCGQGCVGTLSTYCWLSSSLGDIPHVSADDFLEPEEYVEEASGVMPAEAADLGRSRGELQEGRV